VFCKYGLCLEKVELLKNSKSLSDDDEDHLWVKDQSEKLSSKCDDFAASVKEFIEFFTMVLLTLEVQERILTNPIKNTEPRVLSYCAELEETLDILESGILAIQMLRNFRCYLYFCLFFTSFSYRLWLEV